VFGDGNQLRDFNYVDDCVGALMSAGASEVANGKIYNLGNTDVIDLKALAEMMVDLNRGGISELVPFPPDRKLIDIGDYYSDYSLVTRELKWVPKVSLREGLQRTLNFYREHRRHYWTD
jgi:dTDP-glucose 4,6-dehydratase/UDP-glucose 4-epimerase